MAALGDPTGLYSAAVADLYKQGRNALLDVINLERNGEQLREGYLNDLLSLLREVLGRYDNASTPLDALRMLKDLQDRLKDMLIRVSTKQSRNPLKRWRAAQKIKDAQKKLEQFRDRVNLICLLLSGQDMAAVTTRLDDISAHILTLKASSSQSISIEHDHQQLQALRFGGPPASTSRFNILALPPPDIPPTGISTETSTLSSWLLDDRPAPWTLVLGMGGIGKSFLVRWVCLLPEVRHYFQDRILWVRLGTNPQVLELHRDLYEAMSGRETRLLPSIEDGHTALCSLASSRRYLVVLDDAWMAPRISPTMAHTALTSLNFVDSSNGSRIIVTSRDRSILDRLGVQHRPLELHKFSDDNSYTLFCKHAFNAEEAPSDLENYARHLAGRCEGLPFVLEVVGKAMRSKREPVKWELMLHNLSSGGLDEQARVLEMLRLSYDQLSPVQQRRFLALAILDSFKVERDFLPIAWHCMGLLQLDKYKDDAVADCAAEEALEELVSLSLATSHSLPWLLNHWSDKLAWHIIKEEMQSLVQHQEQDGGNSSTLFRAALISKRGMWCEQIKSPMVLPSLKLVLAQDPKVLWQNMHNLLQLRWLHLDGQYESQTAGIGELRELVFLSLSIRKGDLQHYHKIEEALSSLVKMEYLHLEVQRTDKADPYTFDREDYTSDVDLEFVKQMPNLRDLAIYARRATSGFHLKHCHNLRILYLIAHLPDTHLNDLLHQNSSLEEAEISGMCQESVSGYNGFIPTTLKSLIVHGWTGGDPTSNISKPVFNSCQITRLSISLPMESTPESFERLHSLEFLKLDGCGLLAHLTSLNRLPRLKHLILKNGAMQRLSRG